MARYNKKRKRNRTPSGREYPEPDVVDIYMQLRHLLDEFERRYDFGFLPARNPSDESDEWLDHQASIIDDREW
jgi:hypothetical protein